MARKQRKNKKPGILAEFKAFITRGNVVDMATGVIVATAFTKIITSLTNNVFMPIVNWLVYAITKGEQILLITVLNKKPYFLESTNDAGEVIKSVNPECIFIDWGIVIEAVVNFLLIALIIFTIVKMINSVRRKLDAVKAKMNEDEIAEAKVKALEEQRIAAEKEAQAKAEQALADKAKAENESTNALLVEIINLLKK